MIDAIFTSTSAPALPFLLVAKVTIVLALAGAATLLMTRASAATRHMAWAIAIVAVLALPLLAIGGPRWEVGWRWAGAAAGLEAPIPASTAVPGQRFDDPAVREAPDAGAVDRGELVGSAGTQAAPSSQERGAGRSGVSWQLIAWATWALGAVLLLLRVALGWLGTRRLSRRSERETDEGWLQLLKDASWMLDVDREVTLLRSSSASMPMTWGTLRPTILLPAEAGHWPEERRRVVLLHEMAHIARRDCLTQTLAELATALYWFHPLAWIAAGQLRKEREKACDDRVLAIGESATSYAGHLLEVARAYRGLGMHRAAAIGMARPSQLEGRLLAVLDGARRRAAPARREFLLAGGVAALIVVPLAAVHAVQPGKVDDSSTLIEQVRSAITDSRNDAAVRSEGLGVGALTGAGGATADSIVDLTIAARPGGTVVFDLGGGDLRVVGWENDSVELHAQLRGESASGTVVELTSSRDGRVTVRSEFRGPGRNRGGSHRFELRVPISSNLEIASAGGGVALENLTGRYSGSTGGGNIALTRMAGRAELTTGGGSIRVSDSSLDGTVTTGGGDVTIRNNAGDLRGITGGGNVRIENSQARNQASSSEVVKIHTGGGDIELLDLPAGADLSTGGGDIAVRSVGGPLVANTGAGDIYVEEAEASVEVSTGSGDLLVGSVRGSVSAHSGNGDVHVNLAPGGRARSVDLTTGSGDVLLELPADFSGSIDVVITGRNPDLGQLHSDIPLSTEITTVDGRRALVGTGGVGGGRDHVTIHTSSGDVMITRTGSARASAPGTRHDAGMSHPEDAIDAAFSEAFGDDFERQIESLVSTSVGSFASGIAQFTVDVTTSALGVAAAALEQAQREGNLTVEVNGDAEKLREDLRELRVDEK